MINSILGELTPKHIANEVGIAGRQGAKPVVLVEGESDKALFLQFFSVNRDEMLPTFGKVNLLLVIAECIARRWRYVIGIVDSDDEAIAPPTGIGSRPIGTELVETGVRDAEVLVLTATRVIMRMVDVWADPSLLARRSSLSIAEEAIRWSLEQCYGIGCLRRASVSGKWELPMDALPLDTILTIESGLNVNLLITVLVARRASLTDEQLQTALESEKAKHENNNVPPTVICRGHDVAAAMAIYFRKVLGARSVGRELLEKTARAIYGVEDFKRSELLPQLRVWERITGQRALVDALRET